MKRRTFLRGTFTASILAVAATAGLLKPVRILAANWPRAAFGARTEADVIRVLFGAISATPSDAVKIGAPMQGNGISVPISVTVNLANVEEIAVVTQGNPNPLNTLVQLSRATTGYYRTNIKMAKTSSVTAYVKAGGKLFSASTKVKIGVGGYGMNVV